MIVCQFPRCTEDSVASCYLCEDRTCKAHAESHSNLVRWDTGSAEDAVSAPKQKQKRKRGAQ